MWLVDDNPLGQGWGWETGTFWAFPTAPCETGQGIGPALRCALPKSRNTLLPASPPLLLPLPHAQAGVGSRPVLRWGCGGRDGLGAGAGWQSVVSGKAGIFSSTARLPGLPPLSSLPPAVGGRSRPPGSPIPCPSAPCHLLKMSPIPSGSFSVLMSVPATLTLPPQKTEKENWCELGCGGAQLGLLPQHDVLGCMPGVVEEPSPTAESSLKLTSSFFAATLAALAGGGCSIKRV